MYIINKNVNQLWLRFKKLIKRLLNLLQTQYTLKTNFKISLQIKIKNLWSRIKPLLLGGLMCPRLNIKSINYEETAPVPERKSVVALKGFYF